MQVYVAKDAYSFYLLSFFNSGDELTYDWGLAKSYSIVVGKGKISIGSEQRTGVGIFDIESNTPITMIAQEESIGICAFLLDDDDTMNSLFPNNSTLNQLKETSSKLIELEEELGYESITPKLSFDGMNSSVTFSLADLESKVLGAI